MSETLANIKKSGSGKKAVLKTITLGTADSYNIKNMYPKLYKNLTASNFYQRIAGSSNTAFSSSDPQTDRVYGQFSAPSLSYNSSTGALTCGNGSGRAISQWGGKSLATASYTCTTTTYMVYINYE